MKKLLLFLLLAAPLPAQITVALNQPYFNAPAFPGSIRQLTAAITGGTTNLVNWNCTATSGSTCSFNNNHSSLANWPATAQLNIGGVQGNCTMPGSIATVNGTYSSAGGGSIINPVLSSGGSGYPPNTSFVGTFNDNQSGTLNAHVQMNTNSAGVVTSIGAITGANTGYTGTPNPSVFATTDFPFTPISTQSVTVTVTSAEDTSKSSSGTFLVCQNPNTVLIAPTYQNAYLNQHKQVQSWVLNPDESGTWTVTPPSGGAYTVADTNKRDIDFVGTVTGRYTLTYTATQGGQTASSIIYVTPNTLPYPVTPNGTVPEDCAVDPALTGTVYNVGPGQTYADLTTVPVGLNPGDTILIHAGAQLANWMILRNSGTATQPISIRGCADSSGNLPTLGYGGSGLTANPSTVGSIYGVFGDGPLILYNNGCYGFYQYGSCGPNYINVTGLHLTGSCETCTYYQPGASTTNNFNEGAAGVYVGSGSNIYLGGLDLDGTQNGTATFDNVGGHFWAGVTSLIYRRGNHVRNYGNAGCYGSASASSGSTSLTVPSGFASCVQVGTGIFGAGIQAGTTATSASGTTVNLSLATTAVLSSTPITAGGAIGGAATEHGGYNQSYFGVQEMTRFDSPIPGDAGSCMKYRGVQEISRYNYCAAGVTAPTRMEDHVENQDGYPYMVWEGYAGINAGQGSAYFTYNGSIIGQGDTAGANVVAAYFEAFQHEFSYGNIYEMGVSQDPIHYGEDHDGGMAARQGTFYTYNNTYSNIFKVFDTGSGAAYLYPYTQKLVMANNIAWTSGAMSLNRYTGPTMQFFSNLFPTGQVQTSSPIAGCDYNSGGTCGWPNGCDQVCRWTGQTPLNAYMTTSTGATGVLPGDFLFTGTQPYSSTTYAATTANNGTALTGEMALLPVRYQYNPVSGVWTARMQPLTVGAVDASGIVVRPPFLGGALKMGRIQ